MTGNDKTPPGVGGMNLLAWMFIVLFALKLIEVDGRGVSPVHDWSWWWVTSPIWGICLIVGVLVGLKVWADRRAKRKQAMALASATWGGKKPSATWGRYEP